MGPADEEAFFKEDGDEEMHDLSPSVQSVRDTPSPSPNGAVRPPPRPLVDYEEDDDDGSPSHSDGFLAGMRPLVTLWGCALSKIPQSAMGHYSPYGLYGFLAGGVMVIS